MSLRPTESGGDAAPLYRVNRKSDGGGAVNNEAAELGSELDDYLETGCESIDLCDQSVNLLEAPRHDDFVTWYKLRICHNDLTMDEQSRATM